MNSAHRRTAAVTIGCWAVALAWPVLGEVLPRLAPRRTPELHQAWMILAASLTVSCLAPRVMASHARAFAHGVAYAGTLPPPVPPARVVPLRPRHGVRAL